MAFTLSPTVKGILSTAGVAAVLASGLTAVPAAFAAEDPTVTNDTCTYRAFNVAATQTQGVPGQYIAAYSSATNKLFITGSLGRPPIETSTIGVVNPETMQIETVLQLPVVQHTVRGASAPTGYQVQGAYGIDVDDVNRKIWVTETRTNSVSVYDLDSYKLLSTTYDASLEEQPVAHPREVVVDERAGTVFVGGTRLVYMFDAKTFELKGSTVIDEGESGRGTAMNPFIDEEAGEVYFPTYSGETLKIIDTTTGAVKRTIDLVKDDATAGLAPSDVFFDRSLGEIYITAQGSQGVNVGVYVYDSVSGDFKHKIDFGTQTLAVDGAEDLDLVYATDFGSGQTAIIDATTGHVVSTVQTGSRAANDVEVLDDGTAYVLNKSALSDPAEAVTVPFTIDYLTGEYRTSSTENKGGTIDENGNFTLAEASDITANPITKITVSANGTVTGQKQAAETETQSYTVTHSSGASLTVSGVQENGTMTISGTGWTHPDGSGSVAGVLLDDRATVMNQGEGNSVAIYIQADNEGNFSETLPVPTAENSNNAWVAGESHRVRLLSGSSRDGDTARSLPVDVTVEAAPAVTCSAPAADNLTPGFAAFAGYGDVVDTAVGRAVPTPEPTSAPTAEPTAAPSDQPTAAPSDSASADPSSSPAPSSDSDKDDDNTTSPAPSSSSTDKAAPTASASDKAVVPVANDSSNNKKSLAYTGASVGVVSALGLAALGLGAVMLYRRRQVQ